jgi:hypothetical protein
MYPIKIQFWTGCLLTTLVCLPSGFVNQTKVLAVEPIVQIAQKSSAYQEYMLRGYQSTMQRNYRRALGYFQKALEIRPDDRYAKTAIRNVNSYIAARPRGPEPDPLGKPVRRGFGGTRSLKSLFALTPSDKDVQLTTAEHPTFFFFIPESAKIRELKFVLHEGDTKTTKPLYETPVGKKGIVSVSIPGDQPPLKIGKEYTWTFSISYPDEPDFADERVKGNIQRVEDETIADINEIVWENSLSILANLRRQNPNDPDVQQSWMDLLKSVKLDAVANEPLL